MSCPPCHAITPRALKLPNRRQGSFLLVTHDETLARSLQSRAQLLGAVTQASSLEDALLALTPESHFAGVIVDLETCGAPALQAIEHLRQAHALVPLLALASSLSYALVNGIHLRRAELVLKPYGETNVDSFVQRALVEGWLSDEQLAASIQAISAQCQLTSRETDLIGYALGNESHQSVLQRLGINGNVLKVQVRSLLRKCNARSTDKLANVVLRSALTREISSSDDDEDLASDAHDELELTETEASPGSRSSS